MNSIEEVLVRLERPSRRGMPIDPRPLRTRAQAEFDRKLRLLDATEIVFRRAAAKAAAP